MSRVQGKDSDLSSELSDSNLNERCETCRNISTCNVCSKSISGFEHIGVRVSAGHESGIWHYASPCSHRNQLRAASANVKYGGGPIWKNGYVWQSIYWGPYFTTSSASAWVASVEKAVRDIESDKTYSGGLSQYNVGIGKANQLIKIKTAPAAKISDGQIKQTLTSWIASGTIPNLGSRGAYNIFLPPGVTISLSLLEQSCTFFCDYHNTVNGTNGPFYTVEPYPCAKGCNNCTNNPLDTLTQGLSEEMVELKTDMNPGTGWVIGNLELCDYCDAKFVCNRIAGGEYVNSWYDKSKNACWKATQP
jgi:hypothetical protein